MPQTDKTKLFYLLTPFSDFDFIASRKANLLHFLTLFDRSPYLVLLGARPTVLGHSLEKYESSAILSGRPPTVKIITSLIAYRQPQTLKLKTLKISTLFSWNSKISLNWNLSKISTIFEFWTFLFRDRLNYSKLFEEDQEDIFFVERNWQQQSTATLFWIKQLNC